MAKEESELWAQTIFTITPQENGTFREISEGTKISGSSDSDLQLDTNNIVLLKHIRSSKTPFLDPTELSEVPFADAECQTYIQNINKIHIPVALIDEASQTFYIGKQCPATKVFEDVIVAINKKLTPVKIGQISQTIITFDRDYPMHIIIGQLFVDITAEHEDPDIVVSANEDEILKIDAWHILNHVIERAFWISDPKEPILKTTESETQTLIVCNSRTGKAVLEQETQTGLTCTPKASNSELLSDYLKMKDVVKSCLEDCLAKGVYHRIIVDDILDEVLNKCSQEIHFPSMDNASQTLASKILEGRDEDVVRKLRLPVVVDPLESTIVLVPLIDDLLRRASAQVSENAVAVVENIICNLIKKAVLIVSNIEEQRKQAGDKPMDHIFIQRKRKLALSMRQKPETDTASTQTTIAGVPEVEKLKEPLGFPCSVCARGSDCRWCFGSQEDVNLQEEVKILKTQDILLVYRPCYTQTAPAKVKPLQPLFIPKSSKKIPSDTCSKSSVSKTTSSESCKKSDTSTDSVERVLCRKTSPSGWSHVDLPPSKIWSTEDCRTVCYDKSSKKISSNSAGKLSRTYVCKTSSKSQSKSSSRSESKNSSKSQSDLPPQAATALQILKSAFCTRETCPSKDESAEIETNTFTEGNDEVQGPSVKLKKNSKTSSKVISSFRPLEID